MKPNIVVKLRQNMQQFSNDFIKKIGDYDSHQTKKGRMQMDSEKSRTFRNRGKLYVYANLGCCLLR